MGYGQPRQHLIHETWCGAISVRVTEVARGRVSYWP
jgi:hypothetical protein